MKSVFEVKFFLGVFGGVGYPGSAASSRGDVEVGMPTVKKNFSQHWVAVLHFSCLTICGQS